MADWGGGISVVLHRGSNCPLSRAMDGRIMRRGIISSCQSAATFEIVKRCCSSLCKQRYSKYTQTFNASTAMLMLSYIFNVNLSILKTYNFQNETFKGNILGARARLGQGLWEPGPRAIGRHIVPMTKLNISVTENLAEATEKLL